MNRRARRVRNADRLAYLREAPIGIGASRDEEAQAERAHRNAVIAHVRAEVFARDHQGCRCCGRKASLTRDECHEVVSRAKLRGRPPEDIFTTHNCVRLCRECHGKITRHEIDVVFLDPARGCDGPLEFPKHQPRWS